MMAAALFLRPTKRSLKMIGGTTNSARLLLLLMILLL